MKKYILSLFFLISCMIDTYAHTEQQQEKIEISGIVLDQSKEPLVGVNVSVKDLPGLGAITDINGKFKIKVEPYQKLVFTFIGFEKQEILVKDQKIINIVMQEAKATAIDEVVITGTGAQNLLHLFKNMPLTITGLRDFKEAIITKGGVSVKDINPSTMESKLVQGLYFCGEVLDLDALTGGYNLQIAWSTGHLAGISVL